MLYLSYCVHKSIQINLIGSINIHPTFVFVMETDVVKNTAPQTFIARKRRKLILKAKRDYRNRVRSSNLTSHLNHNFTSSVTYETTIETAMARKRRKIILDNRKRLRNLFNTEVSRVQNTNNIVSQSTWIMHLLQIIICQVSPWIIHLPQIIICLLNLIMR